MNKNNIILLIVAILIFVFSVIFFVSSFRSTNNTNITPILTSENTAISEEDFFDNIDYEDFIDFKFSDKNNKELKMSSYLGKPIVVLFSDFTENSEDSNNFKAILELYYKDYKEDVQFFCIDKNNISEYTSEIELYKDIDGNKNYSITQLPTLLFIDSEGNIINQVTKITEDSMEANLDLISSNY